MEQQISPAFDMELSKYAFSTYFDLDFVQSVCLNCDGLFLIFTCGTASTINIAQALCAFQTTK